MTTVTLQPKIMIEINRESQRRQISVDELVNDWLKHYLWELRNKKIGEESKRYVAMHAELRKQYADKVIAMLDGQVVDVGDDLGEVHRRVREKFGDEAVLITKVESEPIKTYKIRSPRLSTPLP